MMGHYNAAVLEKQPARCSMFHAEVQAALPISIKDVLECPI